MKNTLLLSMTLFGCASLVLTGCTKDEAPGAEEAADDETGDGDGDGDGDGGGDEGVFIPTDDDLAAPSECDPFAQDCPDGEKCVPWASSGGTWDSNKCVPVDGDGQPGDSCTSTGAVEATDNCGAETLCWDVMEVDGELLGICTEYCTGTADDPNCPTDTDCLIANDGSINLCIDTCDPLLSECGPGLACFWAVDNFQCIFTTSEIPTGDVCGFINDCESGNWCAAAELMPDCQGGGCCASFCNLTDPTCTQAGTECTEFFAEGMALPGFEDVGVCIVPGSGG